jgi:hypothetical protein
LRCARLSVSDPTGSAGLSPPRPVHMSEERVREQRREKREERREKRE